MIENINYGFVIFWLDYRSRYYTNRWRMIILLKYDIKNLIHFHNVFYRETKKKK